MGKIMRYKYTGITEEGEEVHGSLEAESQQKANAFLRGMKIYPTSLNACCGKGCCEKGALAKPGQGSKESYGITSADR